MRVGDLQFISGESIRTHRAGCAGGVGAKELVAGGPSRKRRCRTIGCVRSKIRAERRTRSRCGMRLRKPVSQSRCDCIGDRKNIPKIRWRQLIKRRSSIVISKRFAEELRAECRRALPYNPNHIPWAGFLVLNFCAPWYRDQVKYSYDTYILTLR
jgi:hypothetical protein